MNIPDSAIPFILFQRTTYFDRYLGFRLLTHAGRGFYKISVYLKIFFFGEMIKSEFAKDMANEFSNIEPHLPSEVGSVLDIGCGVAGIDVFIGKRFQADIYLVDKSTTDRSIHYGFEAAGSFYNSLPEAQNLLYVNGITNVYLQEATHDNLITFATQFDLIISLISWGFHYPIKTYLEEAYCKLNAGGLLILDVRKGTDGEKEVERRFGNIKVIQETRKSLRVLTKKQ